MDQDMKKSLEIRLFVLSMVPTIGLEPTTYALRVRCST